jgi:hypothetical protein
MAIDLKSSESQLAELRLFSAHRAPRTTCEFFAAAQSPSPSAPYQRPELSTAAASITTAPCSLAVIKRPGRSSIAQPLCISVGGQVARSTCTFFPLRWTFFSRLHTHHFVQSSWYLVRTLLLFLMQSHFIFCSCRMVLPSLLAFECAMLSRCVCCAPCAGFPLLACPLLTL